MWHRTMAAMNGSAIPLRPQRVRCCHLMRAHTYARRSAVAPARKIIVVVRVKNDGERIGIGHDRRNLDVRNPCDPRLASPCEAYPSMKSLTWRPAPQRKTSHEIRHRHRRLIHPGSPIAADNSADQTSRRTEGQHTFPTATTDQSTRIVMPIF